MIGFIVAQLATDFISLLITILSAYLCFGYIPAVNL